MLNQKPTEVFKRKLKKVYFDKCVFPYCFNGKHNGHTLFKLPANPKRQKVWREIIDNPLLEGYSMNYLAMKAGVCKYHFDPKDFTTSEQNKLQRCVYPLRFNGLPYTSYYHTSALNFHVNNYTRNFLSAEMITRANDVVHSNNVAVRVSEKLHLKNVAYSASSAQYNDENLNTVSYDGKDPKSCSSFKKDIVNEFNNGATKVNSHFEPNASFNNYASENNTVTGVFRKPQIEISEVPVSAGTSNSKKLKGEISALKELNARLKREKLHYYVKLMNDRKNVQFARNSLN